ncbi:OadG family protein [Magnetofaba australis]|uniref:Probable oxaloacetate decarboxylase gamma chain n=1 Tax=Magnetofaba australis IT-1 TaxID=1434232 RepID=A0A1Y2K278_9PROT|nr:OadG family protein [Magnetofaba australis]OSM02059.1 putative sodium pump decarboxylase subunit gamma [Magnetofaba australis IT-1]
MDGTVQEGVNLMFLGMGTVFTFLALLVVVIGWMSKLAQSIEARQPQAPAPAPKPAPVATPTHSGGDHIAAISAAVARYRHTLRR